MTLEPRHTPPPPVRIDARLMVLVGTGCWLVAGLVLGVIQLLGVADVTRWLWVCGCGIVIGAVWAIRPTPRFTGVTGQDSFADLPPEDAGAFGS